MSKLSRILTGASAGLAILGVVAATAAPSFATTNAWHQVIVDEDEELSLTGAAPVNVTLTPAPSDGTAETATGGTLSVKSNVAWSLKYEAVQGGDGASSPGSSSTGANGTSLSTSGFSASGVYSYAGANATASTSGNSWGVTFGTTGSGITTSSPTALTGTALSVVYSGTATQTAVITPTYSAHTDGTVSAGTYYGVIYYVLSQ